METMGGERGADGERMATAAGVDNRVVVERVEFDEDADAVVAHVRPRRAAKRRCGRCGRLCPAMTVGRGGAGGGLSRLTPQGRPC